MNDSVFLITRPLLLGLLAVFMAVLLLNISQLPLWLFALCSLVFIWRVNIIKERWRAPGHIIKAVLVLFTLALLLIEYRQFAIEPMLALLIVALTLKLLEVRSQKDLILILFLSYFSVACSFLFDQSVLQTLMGVIAIVIVTVVLLQIYSNQYQLKKSLSLAVTMLLQSVVLALVMVLILPRFGPLWTVPLQSGQARTGVSDSMSPGDFNQLIQSNELALRITFADESLPREAMYWRGLVFDQFDGRRWQRSDNISRAVTYQDYSPRQPQGAGEGIRYDVLMEPTTNTWLYAIPRAEIINHDQDFIYSRQGEIVQKNKVNQRIQYSAVAYLDQVPPARGLSRLEYLRNTELPQGSNPQTTSQAQQWLEEAGSVEAYIQRVLAYYKENFTYTLSPPKLGRHSADEFLFSSFQGFCEHFSSSFVILMRSVDIPARVVVGYQGGQWDDNQSYLSVYQRDAHAWAEVWLEDRGWVRVDPTAAVAAERIEQGVAAALPQIERSLVGGVDFSIPWLNELEKAWRQMDYQWQRWVLDFDSQTQKTILEKYLGYITATKLALVVLGTFLLVALIVGFSFFRRDFLLVKKEKRLYLRLQKKLRDRGVEYQRGETVAAYCERAMLTIPEKKSQLASLKKEFEWLLYSPLPVDEKKLKYSFATIKKAIKNL